MSDRFHDGHGAAFWPFVLVGHEGLATQR